MSESSSAAWRSPALPIALGVSSCLLGAEVRYDGGHKKDDYLTGAVSGHVSWEPGGPAQRTEA